MECDNMTLNGGQHTMLVGCSGTWDVQHVSQNQTSAMSSLNKHLRTTQLAYNIDLHIEKNLSFSGVIGHKHMHMR